MGGGGVGYRERYRRLVWEWVMWYERGIEEKYGKRV